MDNIKKIRKYHVGDIIQIYNVPKQIVRIDTTHISTEEVDNELLSGRRMVLWSWEEVKDIPITEFWMKQLEIPVYEGKLAEDYNGIYYDKTIYGLRYKDVTFNDETVSEFQQSFYNLFGKLPDIKIPQDE